METGADRRREKKSAAGTKTDSEFAIDPYFLERAGPVSVLYGKSNLGGVVALVSKRPTQETLREVQF